MTDWFLNFFKSNSAASASKCGSLGVGPSNPSDDSVFSRALVVQLKSAPANRQLLSFLKRVGNGIPSLEERKIGAIRIAHRTPDFSGLNSLEELLLNDCKSLVEVDKSIRCLNKLLVLEMKNCTKLRKLPSGIWMLKSLKLIDVSGCSKLGNLAVFKGPPHKLWCLFFSSWTLPTKGVSSIGFPLAPAQASSCLTKLNLQDCHLSYLPDEIGNLISLRTLNLTQNKLSILPDGIRNLTCLNRLYVGNNKLSCLPSEIGDLDSLVYLNVEKNNIYTIPDSVSNIPRLGWIQLRDCAKLRSLPKLLSCTEVAAMNCPSLESLPLELDQLGRWVQYSESNKLAENNYLTSLLNQLPKSKGLSELQFTVDILFPAGDEEVPIWFPYHDGRGLNVYFVVPPSPSVKQKMLGWILRVLIKAPREVPYQYYVFFIHEVICNNIKKGVFAFPFNVNPSDVDLVWLMYIPQGYRGLQLQGGDEVEIPIRVYGVFEEEQEGNSTYVRVYGDSLKNWAIDLIYEADEIHKGTDTLYQVVSI